MHKKHFIFILILFLAIVLNTSAYAVPDRDSTTDISVPARFWQWERVRLKDVANPSSGYTWHDDFYAGNENKPFYKKGCLVTSFSMLFNYYGLTAIPDEKHNAIPLSTVDPGTLNKWFTDNHVYQHNDRNGDDNLDSADAVRTFYLNASWGGKWALRPNDSCGPINSVETNCANVDWSDSKAQQLLDDDLSRREPDIMRIMWLPSNSSRWHEPHFVLIGGYDWKTGYESYRAYDPNQPYNRYAPYPPGLKWLYSSNAGGNGRGYKELRVDRFTGDWFRYDWYWHSVLQARVYSPVEIQIVSPDGKATGYDLSTGTKITEIPRAYYTEESEPSIDPDEQPREPVKILSLNEFSEGNYILKIFGTGDGPYTIKLGPVKIFV